MSDSRAPIAAVLLCFAAVTVCSPGRADRSEVVDLVLEVGEQQVISTEGVRSYSEGASGIVEIRLTRDSKQFVVVGQHAGTTSLLCILTSGSERHYKITVREPLAGAESPLPPAEGPVEARDNVRLDFYFVALATTESSQVGVAHAASFGGGTLEASFDLTSGSFTSATAVITDQALPRLDFAEATGFAKILRQAAVVTANGTEATFSGGGEVNVRVQGALSGELRSIEFGSRVKVLPRYDRKSGRIELALSAEVSDLTDDSGTGVPGRAKSELQTVVNLTLGQSIVLAGLSARSETRTRAGMPLLSGIPILGVLFGTTASRRQSSQDVVLIVPSVMDGVSGSARARVEEALGLYERFDGDVPRRRLVGEPGGAPAPRGGP
jgi:pilus assembly protein CpaC